MNQEYFMQQTADINPLFSFLFLAPVPKHDILVEILDEIFPGILIGKIRPSVSSTFILWENINWSGCLF